MSWRPWQTRQAPAVTADCASPLRHPFTQYYTGGRNSDAELLRAWGEHLDISVYRQAVRGLDEENKKLRAALAEIASGNYSDETRNVRYCWPRDDKRGIHLELWENAAYRALGLCPGKEPWGKT